MAEERKGVLMGKHHRKWYIDEPIASNKKVQEMMDDLEEYGANNGYEENVPDDTEKDLDILFGGEE